LPMNRTSTLCASNGRLQAAMLESVSARCPKPQWVAAG